ncbi:hypothetical protein DL766_003892 [Monosporascus sp. MC13-8B]|uniref:Uncharacterized protein n=1 Tax=Monosporascus cannonballus TaxID=155416 RepID=A0ABY0HH23_9PEZI|nr:hypothetical protein DL762_001415 [Monosporascus cannonballus]RYP00972.1 hypothetical protein DL763_000393 [Monosporascus cannonballus]RYP32567.1 hypothetical protein DL766_003892 [Monosporascus sp. MC13-8B]
MATRLRRRQAHTGSSSTVADAERDTGADAGPDTDMEPDAAVTAGIVEQTRSVTIRLRQAHLQQTGTGASEWTGAGSGRDDDS